KPSFGRRRPWNKRGIGARADHRRALAEMRRVLKDRAEWHLAYTAGAVRRRPGTHRRLDAVKKQLGIAMTNSKTSSRQQHEAAPLPPIKVTADEMHRLNVLANSSMELFPRVSHFLAREMHRATIVSDDTDLQGVVRMGSCVNYRDDRTGETREVVLVYPHEADIELNRISVLTPVGAALIGLSVGQSMEFQTPGHQTRSLTVLGMAE